MPDNGDLIVGVTRVTGWPRHRGEWAPVSLTGATAPTSVLLACPGCGRRIHVGFQEPGARGGIAATVTFHEDGTLSIGEQIVCPYRSCGWRGSIQASQVVA